MKEQIVVQPVAALNKLKQRTIKGNVSIRGRKASNPWRTSPVRGESFSYSVFVTYCNIFAIPHQCIRLMHWKQTANIYSQCQEKVSIIQKTLFPWCSLYWEGNEEVRGMWALAAAQSQQFDKLVHQSREFPISCKWWGTRRWTTWVSS